MNHNSFNKLPLNCFNKLIKNPLTIIKTILLKIQLVKNGTLLQNNFILYQTKNISKLQNNAVNDGSTTSTPIKSKETGL
jgi:hypothetical protein